MAETHVRLYQFPEGERWVKDTKAKPIIPGYTQLVYAVHPSTVNGGDINSVAKTAM